MASNRERAASRVTRASASHRRDTGHLDSLQGVAVAPLHDASVDQTARSVRGWPPYLTTTAAALYCGFKTTGALRKAAREGRIAAAGRRGGSGTWMWRREDLDAFLCGRLSANLSAGRSSAPPS